MKIGELLTFGIDEISEMTDTALLDCQILLGDVLGVDRIHLIINRNQAVDEKQEKQYLDLVAKRKQGHPVQYLVNKQEFMGLTFYVDENVLIPRSDTEVLVEEIIELFKDKPSVRLLDIGTGSGAITISLAKWLPSSKVWSVDISKGALNVAMKNAVQIGVDDRIHFLNGDLFGPVDEKMRHQFDCIVSNPPYIPKRDVEELETQVKDFEPMSALDGGEDGLDFYRRIVDGAVDYLAPGGVLAFEVGHDQAEEVSRLMEEKDQFDHIYTKKDLQGFERVVIGMAR